MTVALVAKQKIMQLWVIYYIIHSHAHTIAHTLKEGFPQGWSAPLDNLCPLGTSDVSGSD